MKHLLSLSLLCAGAVFAGKPNIIFIYADDMGWTGSSVEMIEGDASTKSDFHQTPNLERLASSGTIFSQAYSPGSMCTPSRASVLTGKTPAELHITTPGGGKADSTAKLLTPETANGLPEDIPTIGSILKSAGYATALLGKWHIGRHDHAGMFGFDLHDGHTENACSGTNTDPKEIFSLTERGIRFMEDSVKSGKPFYLQLSHYAVHTPIQTRPESLEMFKKLPSGGIHIQTDYAAMTWDLDAGIGRIIEAVNQLGIEETTYLVFMSDNGAAGNRRKPSNSPLFAGKGTLYEGGIRVPLIIAGPGIHSGYCTEPVTGTDLLATFASWAKAETEESESKNLAPLLSGTPDQFSRPLPLLFHCPHYGHGQLQTPQTAIISGHWKLLKDWETGTCQLFDLSNDISEQYNMATKEPDRFDKMIQLMNDRLTGTQAQLPSPNPEYDSGAAAQRRRKNQ